MGGHEKHMRACHTQALDKMSYTIYGWGAMHNLLTKRHAQSLSGMADTVYGRNVMDNLCTGCKAKTSPG